MANTITRDQVTKLESLFKLTNLGGLFSSEKTEWTAIVLLQATLNEEFLHKYIHNLSEIGCGLVNATIEQRVQALLKAKEKK